MTKRILIVATLIALALTLAGCSAVGSAMQSTGMAVSRAGSGLQQM